jgi:hypothetical protein
MKRLLGLVPTLTNVIHSNIFKSSRHNTEPVQVPEKAPVDLREEIAKVPMAIIKAVPELQHVTVYLYLKVLLPMLQGDQHESAYYMLCALQELLEYASLKSTWKDECKFMNDGNQCIFGT